jgi:hypothetical protein
MNDIEWMTMLAPALNVFSGAALGASFYILVKTHPYLVNRSYDPKYNAVYISRFITGVIGGVILATALGPALQTKFSGIPGTELSAGVLALLGGYAAEAVEMILQRLVEILLSVVRGGNVEHAQSKIVTARADALAAVEEILPDLNAAAGDPAKVRIVAQKVRGALKKSR